MLATAESLLFREQPFIEGRNYPTGGRQGAPSLLFREQPFIEGKNPLRPTRPRSVAALSGAAFH